MEIKPNINLEEEHKNKIQIAKNYLENFKFFKEKIDAFHRVLKLLKEIIK